MDKLLDQRTTAEILGVTPGTLSVWRSTKRYPLKYIKVGKSVKYRPSDVEAFVKSRERGAK